MKKDKVVSFIIIAYNSGDKIKALFKDIKEQTYNHKNIEIILVDSNSTDETKQFMIDFKNGSNDFKYVKVLDNPKKVLPSGWNIAIKESTGDVILRVDAHSSIPKDFIEKNIKFINLGEKIVGGHRISIIDENNKWQKVLLSAEKSIFGSGIAKYRREKNEKYVKTLAHAAYSKEVFDKVGYYNENLFRTEDNEIHYRMRKAGYKFYFNSDIVSYHYARNSFFKMCKQKFLNGYWIGLTMSVSPRCFSFYHFVPFIFVISLLFSILLLAFNIRIPFLIILILYFIINIIISFIEIIKNKFNIHMFLLPIILFILHISYGVGTLMGLLNIPKFIKNYR